MGEAAPALYRVEEAAKLLRVGRTKAYALTQEWRATGGKSGLPVVDFGRVLRVPRAALETLLGVDLTRGAEPPAPAPGRAHQTRTEREPAASEPAVAPSRKRQRATNPGPVDQLDLFNVAG